MKKLLLLMVFAVGTVWSQTAPSAYTTYKNLRQYALGANPGADSLNAQWSEIDSFLVYPGYSYQDSLIANGTSLLLGSMDGSDTVYVGATVSKYPNSDGWSIYVGDAIGAENGFYAGVPSTTAGGIRVYNASTAFYYQLIGDVNSTANISLLAPSIGAGTYDLLLADADQDASNLGDIVLDTLTLVQVQSVNSVTTEGTFGVPVVVDVVSATAQTVSITATNISSSTATGIYRISAYLEHDVVDVSSDSVYAKITWKGNSGESVSDSTAYCFLTALGNNANDTFFIYHAGAGATSITYEAGITDNGDDAYTLKLVAERLN